MNKVLILLVSSISCIAFANEADTLCDLPESLCKLQVSFDESDKELNDVYELIINNIKSDGLAEFSVDKYELQQTLISSQRSWLQFKKTNCNAFYTLHSGGSQRNEARLECEVDMTNQRIQYLKKTYL